MNTYKYLHIFIYTQIHTTQVKHTHTHTHTHTQGRNDYNISYLATVTLWLGTSQSATNLSSISFSVVSFSPSCPFVAVHDSTITAIDN